MTKKVKKRKIKKKSFKKQIKDLPISKKKVEELKEDKSGSEESMEEVEEGLDEDKFVEFLQSSTRSTAPVLEKVADAPQQVIRLEQDVSGVSSSEDVEEKKLDYSINSSKSNYDLRNEETENQGTNYQLSEIAGQPGRIDMENVGKDLHPAIREATPINPEFQRTESAEYVEAPRQLKRTTSSPLEQRKTEAQELESRMKKYEIR